MPIEEQDVAEKWRDLLTTELWKRRAKVDRLEEYYDGDHPLPSPPKRLKGKALADARAAYAELMKLGVTNWVKLVADAPAERLEVTGFRIGDSTEADGDAWRIWTSSRMNAGSTMVHDNALVTGQSFVLVDPFVEDGQAPAITGEHSSQMIVAYRPGSNWDRVAALKMWEDDTKALRLTTLYLPGSIWKWQSGSKWPLNKKAPAVAWETRRPDGEEWPLPNPLDEVPVVELAANPKLRAPDFGGGRGEFETVLSIQDRINKTVFDRLVTAEFQAFRQRWVVGWTPDIDEETGLPKSEQVFKASQAFVMAFGGSPDQVKVGEFAQAEFDQFLKAVESDVNAMAAISKTPPHYLLGAMVNISGDALVAAESGMVAKTKRHARIFGEAWEEVMRLALKAAGSDAASQPSQVIWADIEHRTWGEQVDAILKMSSLDAPRDALWERLPDMTPADVERWRTMADKNVTPALTPGAQQVADSIGGMNG